jgi:hypothetical protein
MSRDCNRSVAGAVERILVVDDGGEACPAGEKGEIIMR